MKTRSKTTGWPAASKDTRSDSKAGAPGGTRELARLARGQAHRGDGLARAVDDDAQLELEHLAQRRLGQIGGEHLLADAGRQERALQAHGMVVDQSQPLDHHHPGPRGEAERDTGAAVGHRRPRVEHARGHRFALRGQLAREPAQLEDLVVDGRRRHEGAEPVPPCDEMVALEQLERLAQRHQRHAEVTREAALVGQRRARRPLAAADALAQRLGDPVIPRQASDHSTPLSVF